MLSVLLLSLFGTALMATMISDGSGDADVDPETDDDSGHQDNEPSGDHNIDLNDLLIGGPGAELNGEEGNDVLAGRGGSLLHGGSGDDVLLSQAHFDTDGAGQTTLTADRVSGGEGADTFLLDPHSLAEQIDSAAFGSAPPSEGDSRLITTITDFNPEDDTLVVKLSNKAHVTPGAVTIQEDPETGHTDLHFQLDTSSGPQTAIVRLENIADLDPDAIKYAPLQWFNPHSSNDTAESDFQNAVTDLQPLAVHRGDDGDNTVTTEDNLLLQLAGGADNVLTEGQSSFAILGAGNDSFTATQGQHLVNAGEGDDTVSITGDSADVTLGGGNDQITLAATEFSVTAEGGDNLFVVEQAAQPANDSDHSRISSFGEGDDTLIMRGDNLSVDLGDGADTVIVEREAGEHISVQLADRSAVVTPSDSATVTMGNIVLNPAPNDEITVNIYPEHLDRAPTQIWAMGAPQSMFSDTDFLTLNLPEEVTGEIQFSHGVENGPSGFDYPYMSLSTESGVEILRIYSPHAAVAAEDHDTATEVLQINRDVNYDLAT